MSTSAAAMVFKSEENELCIALWADTMFTEARENAEGEKKILRSRLDGKAMEMAKLIQLKKFPDGRLSARKVIEKDCRGLKLLIAPLGNRTGVLQAINEIIGIPKIYKDSDCIISAIAERLKQKEMGQIKKEFGPIDRTLYLSKIQKCQEWTMSALIATMSTAYPNAAPKLYFVRPGFKEVSDTFITAAIGKEEARIVISAKFRIAKKRQNITSPNTIVVLSEQTVVDLVEEATAASYDSPQNIVAPNPAAFEFDASNPENRAFCNNLPAGIIAKISESGQLECVPFGPGPPPNWYRRRIYSFINFIGALISTICFHKKSQSIGLFNAQSYDVDNPGKESDNSIRNSVLSITSHRSDFDFQDIESWEPSVGA